MRKVYTMTEQGHQILQDWIVNHKTVDFILYLPYFVNLLCSGSLSQRKQIAFLDKQLKINNNLKIYFTETVQIPEDDCHLYTATYAC